MPRSSSKTNKDFEDRFFDLLNDRFDRIEVRQDKQDEIQAKILEQARYTNGKVRKLRIDVDGLLSKKSTWQPDTKLLYIAGTCLLVFLLIVAAVLRVEVPAF